MVRISILESIGVSWGVNLCKKEEVEESWLPMLWSRLRSFGAEISPGKTTNRNRPSALSNVQICVGVASAWFRTVKFGIRMPGISPRAAIGASHGFVPIDPHKVLAPTKRFGEYRINSPVVNTMLSK